MSAPVSDVERTAAPSQPEPSRHHPRRWRWIAFGVGGVVAVFALVSALALVIFHASEGQPIPAFESLTAHPDSGLQGSVAYYDQRSRCVRVIAASGQQSKDVLCVAAWQPDPANIEEQGKEMGPQLVWRGDGRLEVTMLFMKFTPNKDERPVFTPGWQKIVDVRTGQVEDVPSDQVPSAPHPQAQPTTSPTGQQITATSNDMTGEVEVAMTDASGTRTLLSARGPGEYSYHLYAAFWAPNWQWVAVDDGRILVLTPTDPAVTRVLVDGAGGSFDYPTFAVTADNVLAPPA